MLMNPAPSSGYNAVLGNIPPSSAPAQGMLAAMNPSVHNNVKEPMVNAVATYPLLVAPWHEGLERYLHAGDLIFVCTAENNVHAGIPRRGKPAVVANLPILNYIMSSDNPKYKQFQGKPHCWSLFGIMRNDMQLDRGDPGMNGRNKQYRRLINVDVRGATRCFNYWGDAEQGNHVYLKWEQVPRMNADNIDESREAYVGRNDATTHKWQLMPSVDSTHHHVKNVTDVYRPADNDAYQKYKPTSSTHCDIHVGWCFQHVGAAERISSLSAAAAACRFHDDRFRLPMVHLFRRT